MGTDRAVLLTGTTGLLGRYLLRDLLLAGRPVAVLARDGQHRAADRVAQLVAFWSDTLGRPLPSPTVLAGDLRLPGLGLTLADRHWLARHCRALIHAAAKLGFRPTPDGEPWRTNVAGTRALYRLCRELGLCEWHHVSTAFVCGRLRGPAREDELDRAQDFHNAYEQSKCAAERWLRGAAGVRVTVHRPSVLVGDSVTGYTSHYAGFYRFLELAVRLARANGSSPGGPRLLPLRLPLTGEERWDLVPVDWVSRAVVELLARPRWHGQTFHLVARVPLAARLLRDVAAAELHIDGVELVGPQAGGAPGSLERQFLEGLREYWPYLAGTPAFTRTNTAAALPDLPPPPLDRPRLARLIRYAVADRWGRRGQDMTEEAAAPAGTSACARYVEEVFPEQARRSRLARAAGLHLAVGLDVAGPGGGQWTCRWTGGELTCVARGLEARAEVTYHTDTDTFDAILRGRLSPQQAFFEERLAITGDLETALKLAALFAQFLSENPRPAAGRTEATDAPRV
jgi:thioester reductase-like protein